MLPNISITLHPILAGSHYTCVCAMNYSLGFKASHRCIVVDAHRCIHKFIAWGSWHHGWRGFSKNKFLKRLMAGSYQLESTRVFV